jgi:hypothetical protein
MEHLRSINSKRGSVHRIFELEETHIHEQIFVRYNFEEFYFNFFAGSFIPPGYSPFPGIRGLNQWPFSFKISLKILLTRFAFVPYAKSY